MGGTLINYDAFAGTLVVHPKGWDDVPQNRDKDDKNQPAEASMFYVAYFKSDNKGAQRPVTFLYNGGPGSSTVWLHMGAFGPKRVVTLGRFAHAGRAVSDRQQRLQPARCQRPGIRRRARAPASAASAARTAKRRSTASIRTRRPSPISSLQFLRKYGRWNSPKYLFGESYGTTRSAVLVERAGNRTRHRFQRRHSAVANSEFRISARTAPEFNPGVDLPYELALPTYAATAWYHHKLPDTHPELRAAARGGRALCDDRLRAGARGRTRRSRPSSARRSSRSCISTPACRSNTSRRRICASTAANLRKRLQDERT